jgi:amino acid adenylation domain-containing protein
MSAKISIADAFLAKAREAPDRVALMCDDRSVTYGELAATAEAIAYRLQQRGIGPTQRVGLYAQRSIESVAAIIGILRTGAAYVPFDPAYPAKMLRFIYEDSAPGIMLVQHEMLSAAPGQAFWDCTALDLSTDFPAENFSESPRTMPKIGADDPAYVMYTSGSTGRPKGVLVPHRAVIRLVIDNDFADFGDDQVFLHLAPLAFDASTLEIWGPLLNGGRLAIVPAAYPTLDDIVDAISRHGVTTLWLTAGLFHLMVDQRLEGLQPLRQLLAGGDVLSPAHAYRVLQALPGCRLINGYGPTENTTFSCCYTIPRDWPPDRPIPIGSAIGQTQIYVLNESGEPVPAGSEGELYVGGAGVALGYLNQPQLTAERFVPDPFAGTPDARLYRTGDRVRLRNDGNLEFLGRVDRQLKINGKRVELDEIEATVRRTNMVQDAAVTCFESANGQRRIALYVTSKAGRPAQLAELNRALRAELPDFMVPAATTLLASLPLSPTGKIDRNRLPPPDDSVQRAPIGSTDGHGEIERGLLEIWRQVLGTAAVGVDDNFFDLGGTSLQLIEAHATIQARLGRTLKVIDLFQFPRISALAPRLAGQTVAQRAGMTPQDRARKQQDALRRARTMADRGTR